MDLPIPLIGLAKERHRLGIAFRNREPLLVLGPQGSGKTRLIREASRDHAGVHYVLWQPSLHELLVAMARALIALDHADFLRRAGIPGRNVSDIEGWLANQTSVHLKGLLWNSINRLPVPMILDGVAGCGFSSYRFLQRIYHTRGMALLAATRDPYSLGTLTRLFWDPARILHIPPLHARDAEQLFDAAAGHFRLRDLDLDDFRDKVLESARGNPGQILEMCRLAALPQYISGRHVKFAPLRIDTVLKFRR